MVRRRSVKRWLSGEVWKMVRRRSVERWLGEKLRNDG